MVKPAKRAGKALEAARPVEVIGWRETVAMPELGIAAIVAKIDTGARTSALHTDGLTPYLQDGEPWIGFRVPLRDGRSWARCAARIADQRPIKNTSGIAETRYVIETALVLGRRRWTIEVSLADRTTMALPLILGRTAIRRRRVVVDPGRSFLAGSPGRDPAGKHRQPPRRERTRP